MIEQTTYWKCRPSQVLNLGNFLLALLIIPAVLLLDTLLKDVAVTALLPDILARQVNRMPLYLSVLAALSLTARILSVRCIRYELDPGELTIHSGILSLKQERVELYRILDYRVEQPLLCRLFGLGNLVIYTADQTTPVITLRAIPNPEEKCTILRGLVEMRRKEHRMLEVNTPFIHQF